MRRWRVVVPIVAMGGLLCALLAPAGTAGPGRAAALSAACGPSWTIPPGDDASGFGILPGVAAESSTDAWSAGYAAGSDGVTRSLLQHWDGSAWSTVQGANAGGPSARNLLRGAAAAGPGEAWAVGTFNDPGAPSQTLAEHLDGAVWNVVPTPNKQAGSSDTPNYLEAVAANGGSDVWAVGYFEAGTSVMRTLIMHWDGQRWSLVGSPNVGTGSLNLDNYLTSVTIVSPADVWAAGYYVNREGVDRTLIMHWDGTSWSREQNVPSVGSLTNQLQAVVGAGPDDVWAVGSYLDVNADTNGLSQTLVLHWDGSAWSVLDSPNAVPPSNSGVNAGANYLTGVAAPDPADVYAVGYSLNETAVPQTLVLHWDGSGWSVLPSPNEGTSYNYLLGVASAPDGSVIASGGRLDGTDFRPLSALICPITVQDSGFAPATATVAFGSQVWWSVPSGDRRSHEIADGSGMGLFDSGLRTPGSSFGYAFPAAGAYSILDVPTGNTGTVKVPMAVSPSSGSLSTVFTISWAATPAPSGYLFKAQVKRPGSSTYSTWTTTADPSATFRADAGTGTYSFRTKVTESGSGLSSGWSPPKAIKVS